MSPPTTASTTGPWSREGQSSGGNRRDSLRYFGDGRDLVPVLQRDRIPPPAIHRKAIVVLQHGVVPHRAEAQVARGEVVERRGLRAVVERRVEGNPAVLPGVDLRPRVLSHPHPRSRVEPEDVARGNPCRPAQRHHQVRVLRAVPTSAQQRLGGSGRPDTQVHAPVAHVRDHEIIDALDRGDLVRAPEQPRHGVDERVVLLQRWLSDQVRPQVLDFRPAAPRASHGQIVAEQPCPPRDLHLQRAAGPREEELRVSVLPHVVDPQRFGLPPHVLDGLPLGHRSGDQSDYPRRGGVSLCGQRVGHPKGHIGLLARRGPHAEPRASRPV